MIRPPAHLPTPEAATPATGPDVRTGGSGFRLRWAGLLLLIVSSCAWNAAGSTGCFVERGPVPLSAEIRESSGLAPVGRLSPGNGSGGGNESAGVGPPLLWTHNDSGSDPILMAVDLAGNAVASVRLSEPSSSAEEPVEGGRFRDLEALEAAPCDAGRCLYVADVGDNEERRDDAAIHRLPEPPLTGAPVSGGVRSSARVETTMLPVRFPDGPVDVEAMFVLPDEQIHLVSKGRSRPVAVYRYPPPLRPDERVTLERVQVLTREPPPLPDYVTGAAASADGRIVAIRTYQAVRFYDVRGGRLVERPGGRVVLRSLREAQGEAVALLPDGRVALTSEAGPLGRRGGLTVLRCPGLDSGYRP